jgi:serine/threonine protein kinase
VNKGDKKKISSKSARKKSKKKLNNLSEDESSSEGKDQSEQSNKDKDKKEEKISLAGRYDYMKTMLLGKGSFGEIYIAQDTMMRSYVAIKLESQKNKNPQLKIEKNILDMMSDSEGFPKVFDYGSHDDSNYMVMELLGPTLADLFEYCGNKFTIQTILLLAIQMIQRIQDLHNKNYIHRDIKPENFLIGIEDNSNTVYLIDFGLSKKYKDSKTMEHIGYKETRQLTGTARYASINNHLGVEQSRRDDLEAIGYVLLYFLKKRLPWQGVEGSSQNAKYKKILERKLSIPIELLCKDLPCKFI